jgi:hypothetical protein
MVPLSREEFLKLGGMTSGTFDQLQHAGHVALAFGSPFPGSAGRYLDLDVVAMTLASELSEPIGGRRKAADFVLGYFDVWGDAVGRAEADPGTTFYFAIGAIGPRDRPVSYLITSGTAEEIERDFKGIKGPLLFIRTDMNAMLARVREAGKRAGIDLSRPFFLAPDHPQYAAIIADEREARERRLRANPKKFKEAQARERRKDVKVIHRAARPGE